jgi:hypothetical protein
MAENIGIAIETRDTGFLSTILDSNAIWNYAKGSARTAEAILSELRILNKPSDLIIDHVISHGKVGAVNGHSTGSEGEQRFCYVIEFTSVKCNQVRRIESYID